MHPTRRIVLIFLLLVARLAAADSSELTDLNRRALEAHGKRNLGDSTPLYKQLLARDPPVAPTAAQRELVQRFAPRLHLVAREFFPLKDIVAILHPEKPTIAYHLFWEDDLGFPSDNDPCDHEVVWVDYDPATLKVTRVATYWHGKLATTPGAAEEANAHGGRPWIGVEWGFHGSVPFGAPGTLMIVDDTLRSHWERAHAAVKSTAPRDPLARGWPAGYAGDYAEFTRFSEPFDPRPMLRERDLVYVSRWANATLARYCLRYNFAAKTEWPWLFP